MTVQQLSEQNANVRRLGPVPWFHDGFRGLSVRARRDVPPFDDPVILGALVRGVLGCNRTALLERALKAQLAPLGYTALLEWSATSRDIVVVVVPAQSDA